MPTLSPDLRQHKEDVFEEADLDRRKEIETKLEEQQQLLRQWREGHAPTADVGAAYESTIADDQSHPVVRLHAYECLASLTERSDSSNRDTVQSLLFHAFSEPNQELQNAQLGILGARLNDRLVLSADQPVSQSLKSQFANTTESLVHELRTDPRVPLEFRQFAETVANVGTRKDNPLWQQIEYMSQLYAGDISQLWPTLKELPPVHEQDLPAPSIEQFIPAQKGRRLLPEGSVCSLEKQIEARSRPRAAGTQEAGQTIPLRVYAGTYNADGSFTAFALSQAAAEHVIAELRHITTNDHLTVEEKNSERVRLLSETKRVLWSVILDKDRELFARPENLTVRVETLFNENALARILQERFNVTMLDATVDPSGQIRHVINDIATDPDLTDDQKLDRIKQSL